MIRGISFSVNNEKIVLLQILKCIDISKYYWYNIDCQTEAWNKENNEPFFYKDRYAGDEFLNIIQRDCLLVFLKAQAYLKNCNFESIHTYQDFLKSECQILMLIYDCSFVEIYVKDADILNCLYNNAINNGYKEVRYITDENDSRTKMDIL